MHSIRLLDVVHNLVVSRDSQAQFSETPLEFLQCAGIPAETARLLLPLLTMALATGIALATDGMEPQYQWEDPLPGFPG